MAEPLCWDDAAVGAGVRAEAKAGTESGTESGPRPDAHPEPPAERSPLPPRAAPTESRKETRRKMSLLGMLGATGKGAAQSLSDRVAARTRWLDGQGGEAHGRCWCGSVRQGASADRVSKGVRRMHEQARGRRGGGVTAGWSPNPEPSSEEWGGRWGKPCGHNEVVMHVLRPFAPMEVLNTRVCSR